PRYLDETTAMAFRQALYDWVQRSHSGHVILNFSGVKYVSSQIVEPLFPVKKRLMDRGGNLFICGLSEQILEVFKVMGLATFFDVFPDLAAARQTLRSQGPGKLAPKSEIPAGVSNTGVLVHPQGAGGTAGEQVKLEARASGNGPPSSKNKLLGWQLRSWLVAAAITAGVVAAILSLFY